MGTASSFVHAEKDGVFRFHASNGEEIVIGSEPVAVSDAVAVWLDTVPSVKRAGGKPAAPATQEADG